MKPPSRATQLASALVAGAIFGFGLALSTMVRPEIVLEFLRFSDLGLLLVLGSAVVVATLFYQLAPRALERPLFGERFELRRVPLDRRLVVGSALFGVGWGLSGVCPGPAIAGLGTGDAKLALTVAGLFVGALAQGLLFPPRAVGGSPRA